MSKKSEIWSKEEAEKETRLPKPVESPREKSKEEPKSAPSAIPKEVPAKDAPKSGDTKAPKEEPKPAEDPKETPEPVEPPKETPKPVPLATKLVLITQEEYDAARATIAACMKALSACHEAVDANSNTFDRLIDRYSALGDTMDDLRRTVAEMQVELKAQGKSRKRVFAYFVTYEDGSSYVTESKVDVYGNGKFPAKLVPCHAWKMPDGAYLPLTQEELDELGLENP